jgi:NAD-dependent dihydropyrimidine dehydrogenase PreA subunit
LKKVSVDFNACKECGYCSLVCPQKIFEKGTEYNSRGYLAYVTVNDEKCVGCKKCFYACPDFAISLE